MFRRDKRSDTFVISRPAPGRVVGARDLRLQETDENKQAVLEFEQGILVSLPDHQLLNGSSKPAFWISLDSLFTKVHTDALAA